MNTYTPAQAQVPEANQDWLKFASLRDVSLLAGGIGLAMFGLVRRSPASLLVGGIGAFIAAKTANDWMVRSEHGIVSDHLVDGQRMEEVARAVTIKDSTPELFGYIRDFSRLPLFLPPVKLVNTVSQTRSIWTVRMGPVTAVVDVEISGSPGDDHLKLVFTRGGTHLGECNIWLISNPTTNESRVTLRLRYHTLLGGLVERVVRPILIAELDTYLFKLKQFAETGEVATIK